MNIKNTRRALARTTAERNISRPDSLACFRFFHRSGQCRLGGYRSVFASPARRIAACTRLVVEISAVRRALRVSVRSPCGGAALGIAYTRKMRNGRVSLSSFSIYHRVRPRLDELDPWAFSPCRSLMSGLPPFRN